MIAFVNNLGEQKGLLLKDRETCIFWFLTMKVIYFNNLNIVIIILNNNLFLNYDIFLPITYQQNGMLMKWTAVVLLERAIVQKSKKISETI